MRERSTEEKEKADSADSLRTSLVRAGDPTPVYTDPAEAVKYPGLRELPLD